MELTKVNGIDNRGFTLENGYDLPVENNPKLENGPESELSLESPQAPSGCIERTQNAVGKFFNKHGRLMYTIFKITLLLLYLAYFGYAMYYEFGDEPSWRLLICTIFGVLLLVWSLTYKYIFRGCQGRFNCLSEQQQRKASKIIRWFLYVAMFIFMIVFTGVDIGRHEPRNLVSLSGIVFFILALYITSTNPAKVNWHPVFWGMAIQYIFALIIIRTSWGYDAFEWLGARVTELLAYSNAGAIFVFGDAYEEHFFAFKVLPVIIYFSSLISLLYYLGVMQVVIGVVGRFLAFCMKTSPTESLNAAGNIFIGMTEAPLMILPFIERMTNSELHAVMTGGFATVSGSVLGAYVSYGVKANYLLGASVMSAPASLAISKLTCPETEEHKDDDKDAYKLASGESNNLIEAASSGASTSIKLVANVAVNLIAFLALLEFFNATLVWFGDRVGVEGLTFQFICSYVFYPMAYLMGVDESDCRRVAQLIGFKTFTNEFVAYIEMGKLLDNGKIYQNYTTTLGTNGTVIHDDLDIVLPLWNTTLIGGILSARSEAIATYALCGFSNLGSMGMQLGAFSAMAPSRKRDLSRLVFRAMIAGNVACFMTACIAGLFYDGVR